MGKPTTCICANKDEDQLCSNCTADQRLCFRHTDSTIHPLHFQASSLPLMIVETCLCRTCPETHSHTKAHLHINVFAVYANENE